MKALELLSHVGWKYHPSGDGDNAAVETCPYCGATGYKFYVNISGEEKDGQHDCKKCGQVGNLYQLKQKAGVSYNGVVSMKDSAIGKPSPLPNMAALHTALMTDEKFGDVLDYLVVDRGFSLETIQKYKLGAMAREGVHYAIYPYWDAQGNATNFKGRSVPPAKKSFIAPANRASSLFNSACLLPNMEELFMVEGEADCLTLLNQGVVNVVGVPGAKNKKAEWIELLDAVNPKKVYIVYDRDKAGQEGALALARRVGIEKSYNIVLPEFEGKDINEWFHTGKVLADFELLKQSAKLFDVNGVTGLCTTLEQLKDDVLNKGTLSAAYTTQYPSLNKRIGGFEDGDVVGVIAEAKVGKALRLTSKIRLPEGWTTMGETYVGQRIASIDGDESVITGVFDRGVMPVYKVTFSDGRYAECSGDHLWQVRPVRNCKNGWYVRSTDEVADFINNCVDSLCVPLHSGILGNDKQLPLDPWLVGAYIGDGTLSGTPRIHKPDQHIKELVVKIVKKYGGDASIKDDYVSMLSMVGSKDNPITTILTSLGFLGKDSFTKTIPEQYLEGSYNQRLSLLQGLMDTDGTAEKSGATYYATSNLTLAKQVQYLVRSLGGVSDVIPKQKTFTYKGEKKQGAPSYYVTVKLNDRERIFTLPRKRVRVLTTGTTKQNRLTIASVEYIGDYPVRCISVSHPSKLFMTDDFIVTHNTTMCLNFLDYFSSIGYPSAMFCLEMLPKRMVRKWVSKVTLTPDVEDEHGKNKITVDVINEAIEVAKNRPADLLFAYARAGKPDEIFETIRQMVRRYSVKFVCFDNLQLMSRSVEHQHSELSKYSKMFKELAMELGIVIFLVIQPHRVPEGQIVSARNSLGTSSIEKDVDHMLCCHRNRVAGLKKEADFHGYVETDYTFEPQLLIKVDLSRYSTGGICTLWMDGSMSLVREMMPDDVTVSNPEKLTASIPIGDV